MAEACINAGADPNIDDIYGNNCLWTAVFNAKGKYEIVELYKKSGANVNSRNNAGRSPLDFAQQINDYKLIEVLTSK
ncbi:MAG: hypothetical protein J0L80_12360 [Chitinophagales bacterium]|nr:hypothetical protein [Chitinophagales bacterium]